jgi:glycosyltransferase involved in cell wall biosynthesis
MDRPLKVLHVLRPVSGGMRQHLIGLVNHLPSDQVETIVVCATGTLGFQPSELPKAKIISLNITGDFDFKNDPPIAKEILRIAVAEQVDLIHAHGVKAGLLCLWATLNRRHRFKVICTFHNQFRVSAQWLKNMANRLIVKILANQVNHIITVSQAIRKELVEDLNVYAYKINCIYNGVDLAAFDLIQPENDLLRQELAIPRAAVLVGTVARLIPQKGIDVLIKAAASLRQTHPDVYFVVIGDGPYRETLELEAAGAGLKKYLFFTGFRTNVAQLLANLDVFVLPTLEEGFSIVTLEAMAVKKPVVVSRVGGLPEIVIPDTGITVPPNQPDQLTAALQDLIVNSTKRVAMGNAAYERVKNYFTLTRMAQLHFDLYQELTRADPKHQLKS